MSPRACALILMLGVPCAAQQPLHERGDPCRVVLHSPLYALLDEPVVRLAIVLDNPGNKPVSFRGAPVDTEGRLRPSGDWALEIRRWSGGSGALERTLHVAGGKRDMLPPGGSRRWTCTVPVEELFDRGGSYELEVRVGQCKDAGHVGVCGRQRSPAGITIRVAPTRRTWFTGEAVTARLTVRTEGPGPRDLATGGDYRGIGRHARFVFAAESLAGHVAVDPVGSCVHMGGISRPARATPGQPYEDDIAIADYLRFPGPGTYRVRAYVDVLTFGSRESSNLFDYVPAGVFDVDLRLPTAEEATARVDELARKGRRRVGLVDLADLRHPVYLAPILARLAAAKQREEIECLLDGLGAIPTVPATRALLRLADDERAIVRQSAWRNLAWRLPRLIDSRVVVGSTPRSQVGPFWEPLSFVPELVAPLRASMLRALAKENAAALYYVAEVVRATGNGGFAEPVAAAAARIAPEPPSSETVQRAVSALAGAAGVLRGSPVAASRDSSFGRLCVWVGMLPGGFATGIDWELLVSGDAQTLSRARELPAEFAKWPK